MIHGILHELKRLLEALLGRWSLEAFKDTIRYFTDEAIRTTEESESSSFQSGNCTVVYHPNSTISAKIILLFLKEDGQIEQFEAQREFSKKRFLSETLANLRMQQEIVFPIERPRN